MPPRPFVLVGKTVVVRTTTPEPSYYTDAHRRWVGSAGTVHAVVAAQPRENPLVKVKFADEQVVFYRLTDLDVRHEEPMAPPERHGKPLSVERPR